MSKKMSEEKNIHASCVAIGTQGVLLLGPSGAGKSDLALRLIDEGAKLVADDRTILFLRRGVLNARAPATIKGLLEIRGLGIVKSPACASVAIALVVRLGREGARLPAPRRWRAPLTANTMPPQIALDARFASAPAKVRAALAAHARGLFRGTFISK
jgi:hypothetical protein